MVYTVQVPSGATGAKELRGQVEYQLVGMVNPATGFASPDPLQLSSVTNEPTITHQTAAAYAPGSSLTVTNSFTYSNQLLSLLWRPRLPSGWVLVSASGDGNPEVNFGEILWTGTLPPSPIKMVYIVQIPSSETGMKQIRAEVEYQSSGMVNPATAFASPDPLPLSALASGPIINQHAAATYTPGNSVTVTNSFIFTNKLLSLLWRPRLPSGWTLASASGSGNPEVNFGEILWTGTLPSSPIKMVYTVQVPAGESGDKQVRAEVEYQFLGMVNPAILSANPDPLGLASDSDADGLPDAWEQLYFGNPTAAVRSADSDLDGHSNWQEFLAGTDPTNPNAVLKVISVEKGATGGYLVRWLSADRKVYTLQRSTNLIEGFVAVVINIVATPPTNSYLDGSNPSPSAYYRIAVEN
ncbi:MAG: hypothetical protein AAB676_21030, partial [Verrucomicrobiota bacterium]